ncbi:hypothetical protein [Prevotella sp. 885]|uniref:hypothetical protein n=1 Tax=Prevotella sp. 885 TaxID=2022527 RepID=UPI00114110EF|nr:hypothetical protein [Prevotella sp. 885]
MELSHPDANTLAFCQSCMQTAIFWNPFGYIQKNNPTLEHYIKNVHKTMEVVFYDIKIGIGIARAEGTLAFIFVPYEMLILSIFKKLRIFPIQNSHFLIFLIITCGISILFTHYLGQKNEEYIGYFHKFESHKNNAVWHVISSMFFIGAVCAGIISIMWWHES